MWKAPVSIGVVCGIMAYALYYFSYHYLPLKLDAQINNLTESIAILKAKSDALDNAIDDLARTVAELQKKVNNGQSLSPVQPRPR